MVNSDSRRSQSDLGGGEMLAKREWLLVLLDQYGVFLTKSASYTITSFADSLYPYYIQVVNNLMVLRLPSISDASPSRLGIVAN